MKILIVGESWQTFHTHIKGFDPFFNSSYETGVTFLKDGLEANGITVDYLPNHLAGAEFPISLDELQQYHVVILSDIGSNTLLLHPDTFTKSIRTPNRLKLLKAYVEQGGGLAMIGGYLTFQGIDGKGQWHNTAVEEVLPVWIHNTDDRVEVPEGCEPTVCDADHPILAGIPSSWPWFLGYNRVKAKDTAQAVMEIDGDPFVAVQEVGRGRTGIFASDCAPHWGPPGFVQWEYYPQFWTQFVRWLAKQ